MKKSDTSSEAQKVQYDIYHNMPLHQKAKLIFDAYHTGQSLKMTGLRLLHPHASEKQLWHFWAEQHLGSDLYQRIYGNKNNE